MYGYQVEPFGQDSLVEIAEITIAEFVEATEPGAWMVDLFPAREYCTTLNVKLDS